VPLEADYWLNRKVASLTPGAELLFVRSLAFAKLTMTDGCIFDATVVTFAARLRQFRRHIPELVAAGLWVEIEVPAKGWRIAGWEQHNPSNERIIAGQTARKNAGIETAHKRWHVGPEGKPNPNCPLCTIGAPIGQATSRGWVNLIGSVYTETETETETETPIPPATSSPPPRHPVDNRRQAVIDAYTRHAITQTNRTIKNETAYRNRIAHNIDQQQLDHYLNHYPTAPPDSIAAWLHGETGTTHYHQRTP
jgi:hypothetical protein